MPHQTLRSTLKSELSECLPWKRRISSSKKRHRSILPKQIHRQEKLGCGEMKKCPVCGWMLNRDGTCPFCEYTKVWIARYGLNPPSVLRGSILEEGSEMSRNRLICAKCTGRVLECYARTGGSIWWKVRVCLNCGWIQKRRSNFQEVSSYA